MDEDQNKQPEQQDTQTIMQAILADPGLNKDFNLFNNSSQINIDMANEFLSILREIDNPFYDVTSNRSKYINLETDAIPYSDLRRAARIEPARLIINKRRMDLLQWGQIRTKDGVDRGVGLVFNNEQYQPTKAETILLKEWEQKIFNNLFFAPYEQYPNMGKWLGANYEDYFGLDDLTWEYRRDWKDRVVAVHSADPVIFKPIIKGSKFRTYLQYEDEYTELLRSYEKLYGQKINLTPKEEEYDYALTLQGNEIGYATSEQVRKFHFFVMSNYKEAQRGYSIAEQGLRMATAIMNAITMNTSNFNNSRLPLGFLYFTGGGVSQLQLEKLKKTLYAYQNGANNQSKYPMMSSATKEADAKFVNMRPHSRDAEYHQFMTLLFSIYCQLSGTDPREIALGSYADAVGKKTLFEESSDGLIKESRDAGLRTFLIHIQDSLNAPFRDGLNLFQKITGMDVRCKFYGFEIEDKQKKTEIDIKSLSTTNSFNDLLAREDKPKQTLMLGDVNIYDLPGFANAQIYQAALFNAQQVAQQQMQQQQMAMQGDQNQQQQTPEPQPGKEEDENGYTERDKKLLAKYEGIANAEDIEEGDVQ